MTDTSPKLYLSLAAATAIYERVSAETGVPMDKLLSESREPNIVRARRMVMAAMQDRGASVMMIGKRMQLNHSSVIYGLRKYQELAA